jgi:hypothetical protein
MSLIVSNIPKTVTFKELQVLFGKAGSCSIQYSSKSQEAIVLYSYSIDAHNAFHMFENYRLNDKLINVIGQDIPKNTGKVPLETKNKLTLFKDKYKNNGVMAYLTQKRKPHMIARATRKQALTSQEIEDEIHERKRLEDEN